MIMPVELLRHITYSKPWEKLSIISPAIELSDFIDTYIVVEPIEFKKGIALSDGMPTIVVLSDKSSSVTFVDNNDSLTLKGAWFCSPQLKNIKIEFNRTVEYMLIIRLKPMALKYISNKPKMVFRSKNAFELSALFGEQHGKLLNAFAEANNAAAKVRAFENFISVYYKERNHSDKLFDEAVACIRLNKGNIVIRSLVQSLRINYKWLERSFVNYLGVSPKEYARLLRILNAYNILKQHKGNLLRVAVEGGFYDENHLVKEFKEFFGDSPRRYLEEN